MNRNLTATDLFGGMPTQWIAYGLLACWLVLTGISMVVNGSAAYELSTEDAYRWVYLPMGVTFDIIKNLALLAALALWALSQSWAKGSMSKSWIRLALMLSAAAILLFVVLTLVSAGMFFSFTQNMTEPYKEVKRGQSLATDELRVGVKEARENFMKVSADASFDDPLSHAELTAEITRQLNWQPPRKDNKPSGQRLGAMTGECGRVKESSHYYQFCASRVFPLRTRLADLKSQATAKSEKQAAKELMNISLRELEKIGSGTSDAGDVTLPGFRAVGKQLDIKGESVETGFFMFMGGLLEVCQLTTGLLGFLLLSVARSHGSALQGEVVYGKDQVHILG